jgi:rod shape-determining protein MreD
MAYLAGLPILLLFAILQSAVLSHIGLLDGRPDLVLLAVVGWSLTGRWRESMIWGFVGGLFLDLLSGVPFATSAVALVIVASFASLLEGRFWEANLLIPLGVTLAASLVYHAIVLAALLVAGHRIDLPLAATRVVLPSTFLNLVFSVPAAQLAETLKRALFPPEVAI